MPSTQLTAEYGLYIDGNWRETPAELIDVDPTSEETFATAPDATMEHVSEALDAARRAFDTGAWSRMSGADRSACLTQLGEALMAEADGFAELARAEWGSTDNERIIQVDGPAFMALRQAEIAAMPMEEEISAFGAAGRSLVTREPLGVVSILTPWNFPHTLNVMKVAAALAAGNTVVLKPSPLTPLSGLALAKLIDERTDIPAGVVNVVTTSSLECSRKLVTDPRVDMVSFTGSTPVGKQVMADAAGTMKRVLLECGGKSASIYLDDVDLDATLPKTIFEGCILHAGQACILHSRLLVPESLHDEAVARLVELAAAVKIGDPADPATEMGPLISAEQRERVLRDIETARGEGAEIVYGGGRPEGLSSGYFVEPTIVDNVDPSSRIAQEEVFGPVLSVLTYQDLDEAVAIANDSIYGLVGGVWGADTTRALDVARRLRTGQVAINGTGPGDAPFGGFKQSGIGREGGIAGLHQYTEPKAIGVPA